MNLNKLSNNTRMFIINDSIQNNKGPIWDLVRKSVYWYFGIERPICINYIEDYDFNTIYLLNPLNNKNYRNLLSCL